jgi:hypothetical protein
MPRRPRLSAALAAIVLLAACEQAKSSNPLSPAIAGPIAGVVISAPQPMSPANGAQVAVDQQPLTLTIQDASSTGVRPLTYTFAIAIDAAFQTIVLSQTGVKPGGSGQTSFRLSQTLPPDHTYYWRVQAQDGANASDYATSSFAVFTPVVIQPPTPTSPADGSTVSGLQPALTVVDSSRTGPAGAISYVFQVATDGNMTNIVATGQVAETASQTSFTPGSNLSAGTKYFWRARGLDPSHSSVFSNIVSFSTPAAPSAPAPPPPGTPLPPGSGGTDTLTNAVVLNSPFDLGTWPITTQITSLNMASDGVEVLFTKRDGPGRWPDVIPPGFTGPLEYTLGMCLNISGQWYCSAVIEFWNGLDKSGGPPDQYALNWFYDPIRWAPMTGHQPAVGETIGIFVCAGDCRNNHNGDASPVHERSNVVLVPMPSSAGAAFTFSRTGVALRIR